MGIANRQFLQAIFGDEWSTAHVTSFFDDPGAIDQDRRGICWAGGEAGSWGFEDGENQYFTISLFNKDGGRANRRKTNFKQCHVIVADDVKEKLPIERVEMLPAPSYKLLTSAGSEQWGWILKTPCSERGVVEALLDGLVAKGLAPDGTDPGMRGVTRYVRLPEGTNTKASRNNFKCQMLSWKPELKYTMEGLAEVFDIDLTPKEEKSVEAVTMPDHPIWAAVTVTGYGADGWVRIDCPNAAAHSSADASGAAVRTIVDGSVQFKCNHGHCAKLNGAKIVNKLGITDEVDQYQLRVARAGVEALADKLGLSGGGTDEPEVQKKVIDPKRYIFIAEKNKFWDCKTRQLVTPAGIDNRYLSVYPRKKGKGASEMLLQGCGLDDEADGMCWEPTGWTRPGRDEVLVRVEGRTLINEWSGFNVAPNLDLPEPDLWLEHAEYLLPDAREREVVLDYLACIVQRIDVKPDYWLVHRGGFGVGKDLFYSAVMFGLGDDIARTIHIDKLLDGWGDYIRGLKFAAVEEVDKAQDKRVANAMKVICASGASKYRTLNLKGGAVVRQRDCLGGVLMSNKRHCLAVEEGDRRYFVVDSYIEPKSEDYYQKLAEWYRQGGYEQVMGYLGRRDISNFNPHKLPFRTEGLEDLVRGGKFDYEKNMDEMAADRSGLFSRDWFSKMELRTFAKQCQWKCGVNGLEEAVQNVGYVFVEVQKKIDGKKNKLGRFWVRQEVVKDRSVSELYDVMIEKMGSKK